MRRVTLVRHGQASFGADNYDCLSETGKAQAIHLGRILRLQGEAVDALWSGTMHRQRDTAEACRVSARWAAPLRSCSAFDEFDHEQVLERFYPGYRSKLADKQFHRSEFAALFQAAMARWTGGAHDGDYTESWSAFRRRTSTALESVLQGVDKDHHAVVFTSGGVISVIVQALLGLSDSSTLQLNLTLANGSLTRLRAGAAGPRLMSLNEHSHFGGRFSHLLSWR
jgi:broad specificity phosphatase PhoE